MAIRRKFLNYRNDSDQPFGPVKANCFEIEDFVIGRLPRSIKLKDFRPAYLLAAAAGLLAGLSIYLYLPYLYSGAPAFNYAGRYDAALQFHPVNLASPGGLWWLVSGKSFAGAMFAYQGAALWNEIAWSGDRSARQLGEEILETVRQDAVVFGWWDTVPPVQYLQLVEGERPDVQAVNRFLIGWEDLTAFAMREAAYSPIYIDSFPEDWGQVFRALPVGELFRLELREGMELDRQHPLAS